MRYSYIEVFIDEDTEARYDKFTSIKHEQEQDWYNADGGLLFHLDDNYTGSIRTCRIKIPEAHPLFNWSMLDQSRWRGLDKDSFSKEQYKKMDTYAVNQLRKAGVPLTLEKTRFYNP